MLGDWQARLRAVPSRAVDGGLVLAVAAAMVLSISIAEEPEAARSPDVLAYLLAIGLAALLLWRRHRPLGVLIASVGVLLLYYGLDYPAFSAAVPLAAAAYSAAVAGYGLRAATIVGTFVVIGGALARPPEGEALGGGRRARPITHAAPP